MKKISPFQAFIVFFFVVAATAFAADGDLDTTFGTAGKTTLGFTNFGFDAATSIAVQPDGKIVTAGFGNEPDNFYQVLAVARFNPNGSPDPTFGNNGRVLLVDVFSFYSTKVDVALQTDGKIVVVGGVGPSGQNPDFGVVRLQSNGNPDGSFGSGGKATFDFFGLADNASSVVVQSNGMIVIGGSVTQTTGDIDFGLLRIDSAGNPDVSFGTLGKLSLDFFGNTDNLNSLTMQNDGKFVAAGTAWSVNTESDFAVARFTTGGSPDATFGNGGKATISFFGHDEGTGSAIQADGKIVVVGGAGTDSILTSDFGVARFSSAGQPDAGFGNGGKTTTDFFSALDYANDVVIQADGKIVVAGWINPDISDVERYVDFGLARYDTGGILDPSFGSGGLVNTDFGSVDHGEALAIDANCRIVVAGYTWPLETGDGDFALARYSNGGCVEPPKPTSCPRGQGYWKNHPEQWPVNTLMLGSRQYTKTELLALLKTSAKGNASVILAYQLIAAKLNVANGADSGPVSGYIAQADAILAGYSGALPYAITSSSSVGHSLTDIATILDDYNNGKLTPACTE